jgi:lipopolysaccharide biosynthesis glycosyltransferase
MEKQTIHIACALDDKFVMTTGVMLVSLFETNKSVKFYIHIFSSNLKNENINILQNITNKYNSDFEYYHIQKAIFESFRTDSRISSATYYRILIPKIIDRNVKKILYLDGDITINGDITALWETEMNGFIIAGVNDAAAVDMMENKRLNIPEEFHYFNAGMLLIDTEKWNAFDTTPKLIEYLNQNFHKNRFFDQDALNAILYDKCKKLPPVWNQQIGIYYIDPKIINDVYSKEDIVQAKKNPVIIHFNGKEKPWHYVSLHPYKKKFRHYLAISGLKNLDKNITLKKLVKKEVYRIFGWARWNGHIHEKYKKLLYAKWN